MTEIEFSVMEHNPGDAAALQPLLTAFERQYRIHVRLTAIPWNLGWPEIMKIGLYGHGPDVSEIGSTWIGSLASMNVLRPFAAQEIRALGGAPAFFETSWKTGALLGDETQWAIPWLGDVRVTYYWCEALEKAGVEAPSVALANPATLAATLEKLVANGYAYPLALTGASAALNLHEACSWVWGAGGDFMSADGKQVVFAGAEAMAGWRDFFGLRRFVSPETLEVPAGSDLFFRNKAVVMFSGPWLGVVGLTAHPEWASRVGVTAMPGVPYVGGSCFAIWQHSHYPRECFELIRFLSQQPTRIPASPHAHLLPTRQDVLDSLSAEADPFHQAYLQGLALGRSFPTLRMWGLVEEKLSQDIAGIWRDLFADPALDVETCLNRHLVPLAQRLNVALMD